MSDKHLVHAVPNNSYAIYQTEPKSKISLVNVVQAEFNIDIRCFLWCLYSVHLLEDRRNRVLF